MAIRKKALSISIPSLNLHHYIHATFLTTTHNQEPTAFEFIAAYVHRAGFNAVVVVVYRPGSRRVTSAFFDDFSDLLERLATYSAPLMIVGDFNIHVDDATDTDAGTLLDILVSHGLLQNVNSATHRHGHTLDLLHYTQRPACTDPSGRSTATVRPLVYRCRLRLSAVNRRAIQFPPNPKLARSRCRCTRHRP